MTEVVEPVSPATVEKMRGAADRLDAIANLLHESVVNAARQVDLTRVLAGAEVELRDTTASVRVAADGVAAFIESVDALVAERRAAPAQQAAGASEGTGPV